MNDRKPGSWVVLNESTGEVGPNLKDEAMAARVAAEQKKTAEAPQASADNEGGSNV